MRLFALACALGVFLASMQAQGTGEQRAATQPDLGNQTATGKGRSQTTNGGAANAGQPKQGKGGGAAPGKSDTPSTKSYYLEDICSLATASQVSCLRVGTAAAQPIPTPTLPTPVTPDNCHRTHAQTVVNSTAVNTQLGGAPSPFKVTPVGPFLYIYSSTTPPASGGIPTADQKGLAALEHSIADVAAASQGFTEELPVANAVALGNSVAASLQAIAPAGIKVTTTGTATIQVTSDGTVSCAAFSQLLKDFHKFETHTAPDTPVADVFFMDPAATAAALGATAIPYAQGGAAALPAAAAPAAGGAPGSTGTGGTPSGGTGSGTGSGAGTGTGASGGGGGTGSGTGGGSPAPGGSTSGSSTGTGTQVGGGSTTAGGTAGSPTATSGGQTITISTTTTPSGNKQQSNGQAGATPGPTGPVTMTTISTTQPVTPPAAPTIGATPTAPVAPTPAAPYSVNGRDLYFSGGTPGDDAWITEKKRALALLDLPQPQVLVNAWSIQTSTSKAIDSGQFTSLLHEVVNSFNDTIDKSLYIAWHELREETEGIGYFNEPFLKYITRRTVAEPLPPATTGSQDSPTVGSNVLAPKNSPEPAASDTGINLLNAASSNCDPNTSCICPPDQYCLGYTTLFRPTQPRLTDMLLTLLAADKPGEVATRLVQMMENGPLPAQFTRLLACGPGNNCNPKADEVDALRGYLLLAGGKGPGECGCEQMDEEDLLQRFKFAPQDMRLPLECFRESMAIGDEQVGLARAALADFLFNYKFSQQYPHEFTPYDLTSSAQTLDSALAPFVHAFNEDLQAFQMFVRAELVMSQQTMKLNGDKSTFTNDGIITVQTTSGDVATVNTGTQSYLNASSAPSISQLLSSVTGATPSGSSTSNALTGVIANLSFNQAQVLEGALAAYQTTELSVGRQLNLVVKPRSLLGAQAAEIDVQFNADQGATAPSYWKPGPTGGAGNAADLSAVTQHDVTTHVRIDSIKLFDISSLTAVLSKGRDKFPVLPPFVEIPYIGTLLGVPLPAAREFHTSSAVMSAVVVPTATDIAYSLRFSKDRILTQGCKGASLFGNPECGSRAAMSIDEFGNEPIREFHRLMVRCLSRQQPAADTSSTTTDPCRSVTFANALYDGEEDQDE